MTSMTSFKNKYKLFKITWWDIQTSEKSWINEDDILQEDIAVCHDVGYIFKRSKDKLWLFTSYHEGKDSFDVGGLTVLPIGVIKNIEEIK